VIGQVIQKNTQMTKYLMGCLLQYRYEIKLRSNIPVEVAMWLGFHLLETITGTGTE